MVQDRGPGPLCEKQLPAAVGGEAVLRPSHFLAFPCCSLLGKTEAEVVAQNIMIILKRRGDRWDELTLEDYKAERLKDGYEGRCELDYFGRVYPLVNSADKAAEFASVWKRAAGRRNALKGTK